jgi:NAD+ kinase
MSSTTGSTTPSAKPVRKALVFTVDKPGLLGDGLERLERVAAEADVELISNEDGDADVAVVLGGDGTTLRALRRTLGKGTPVIGVNFGAVGFLTSMEAGELEAGLKRVFAGEYTVAELATLELEAGGDRQVAVNDVVVASSIIGRMIELSWAVGGEEQGVLACDGVLCCTPSGSTGYNLSNGGPVLVWGIDAQAVTFIAPHSLHARTLIVPRGRDVAIENRTPDVPAIVLVDGHQVGELANGERAVVRLGDERTLLAHLPEVTFFRRYRETFAS